MNIASEKPGFFVQDGQLYSKDNEKVVLRGINHMFIWTEDGRELRAHRMEYARPH